VELRGRGVAGERGVDSCQGLRRHRSPADGGREHLEQGLPDLECPREFAGRPGGLGAPAPGEAAGAVLVDHVVGARPGDQVLVGVELLHGQAAAQVHRVDEVEAEHGQESLAWYNGRAGG
jgi:hypothetical protein